MSLDKVEVVRRVSNGFTETQQLSDLVSPDLVWCAGSWADWYGQPEYYGHEGFAAFFAEWTGAYEEWTQEIENIVDAGGDHVISTSHQQGRLRGSSSWVELRLSFLYTVEDGRIVRGAVYAGHDQALKAARAGRT
jgi:ketosteroid isomerase-like protein